MQAFVEYMITQLVDFPAEVEIKAEEQAGAVHYEVKVNPQDMGKIIGRRGVTINALRSLLTAGAAKKGIRCNLSVVDLQSMKDRGLDNG